ncbi:hypothetical protein ACFPIJ_31090 [Dactylosporangium cerinum]|uniref:Uncharacterized protein n=1 Tax=Dactylosporangium cerinum TaxID=1434730 RepID=A0ABV9W0T2_9ACTN
MQWGPVARVARPRRTGQLLSVLLLALAVSWLALGVVHDPTAGHAPSAAVQDSGCQFLGNPGGPARCDHGGNHGATGRLQPATTGQDGAGAGYPADIPADPVDQHSPTARPPARPSLAELQAWRR